MYNRPTALRSVLAPKYLEHCLSQHYDIGAWEQCLFWLRGLNDTYKVRTPKGYYIVRIYRNTITDRDVMYELALLERLQKELANSATEVSVPIAKKDQSLYTIIKAEEGQRIAVVFNYLHGIENMLHDKQSCYTFGRSAAELHAAMDKITLELPRYELDTNFLIQTPLSRIISYLGDEHAAVPYLQQFARALTERIQSVASQGLDWGICHGDMHGNNNAFQVDESFTHYDFEWAAKGWRAYDLAQVRCRKRLPQENKDELWQALMSGYRSVRPFSKHDEEAIELFIVARRFWVMGLDVEFIDDTGALDFSQEWLDEFINEFRSYHIV